MIAVCCGVCSTASRRSLCSSSECWGSYLFLFKDEAGSVVPAIVVDNGHYFLEGGG